MPIPSKTPTRLLLGVAALSHATVGGATLLFLDEVATALGAIVSATRSSWQAVGMFELLFGLALFLAVYAPRRHRALVLLGVGLSAGGAATAAALVGMGEVEVLAGLGLAAALALVAAVAFVAWRDITRPPAPAAASLPDPKAMSTTTMSGLQQTLQALAAPASVQLSMFPELIANGDRVMADFRAWQQRALEKQGALSPNQQQMLAGVTERLEGMLREEARGLWCEDAVRSSREWGELRAAARRALMTFAWSVDMPMGVLRRPRPDRSSVDLRPPV